MVVSDLEMITSHRIPVKNLIVAVLSNVESLSEELKSYCIFWKTIYTNKIIRVQLHRRAVHSLGKSLFFTCTVREQQQACKWFSYPSSFGWHAKLNPPERNTFLHFLSPPKQEKQFSFLEYSFKKSWLHRSLIHFRPTASWLHYYCVPKDDAAEKRL